MSDKYIVTSTYIHFQITDYNPNFSDIIIIVVIFTTLMNFQIILYVYIYITQQYYSMVNVQILSRATLSRFRVCIIFAQFLPFFPSTCILSLQISSFIPKPRACIPSISFSLFFSTTLFVTRELYLRCHFSHAYARATCVICTRYRCCGRLGRMGKKIRKGKGEREWNR